VRLESNSDTPIDGPAPETSGRPPVGVEAREAPPGRPSRRAGAERSSRSSQRGGEGGARYTQSATPNR
jgi:hypothetical protein